MEHERVGSDPARAYARALHTMAAAEEAVVAVYGEMVRVREMLRTTPELAAFLREREVRSEGKRQALLEIFEGRLHPLVLDWLTTLAGQGRAGVVAEAVGAYLDLAGKASGRSIIGEAVAAFPLSDEESARLETALSELLDQQVQLAVRVDPSVMGGVRIRVGSRVIDGTARHRLEQIREQLAG
jgi:ATP synthase F1 delta subunit